MPSDTITTECPCSYGAPQDCPYHADEERRKIERREAERRMADIETQIQDLEVEQDA